MKSIAETEKIRDKEEMYARAFARFLGIPKGECIAYETHTPFNTWIFYRGNLYIWKHGTYQPTRKDGYETLPVSIEFPWSNHQYVIVI